MRIKVNFQSDRIFNNLTKRVKINSTTIEDVFMNSTFVNFENILKDWSIRHKPYQLQWYISQDISNYQRESKQIQIFKTDICLNL